MDETPEKKQLETTHWLGILAAACLVVFLAGLMIGRGGFWLPVEGGGGEEGGGVPAAGRTTKPPKTTENYVGGSYVFGEYEWRVLDIRDGKALLVTQDVIALRSFNTTDDPAWETCSLRQYLNGEFYESFSGADRARIIETDITTTQYIDEETEDGVVTKDRIFLLSTGEVVAHFSFITDRIALYEGSPKSWRLRTPRRDGKIAAVSWDGSWYDTGSTGEGGVRPALWVRLDNAEAKKIEPSTAPQPNGDGAIPVALYKLQGSEFNPLYAEKIVEVKGQVKRFYSSNSAGFYIELQGETDAKINCYFTDPGEIAKVAELYEDSTVIVSGRYTGGKYDTSDKVLRECKIRMADGQEIKPAVLPPIQGGVYVLTVDEYIALDVARNKVRGAALFGGAKVSITAKVTGYLYNMHRLLTFLDEIAIYVGRTGQTVGCHLSENEYFSYTEKFKKDDMVTMIGEPSEYDSAFLKNCTITKAAAQ